MTRVLSIGDRVGQGAYRVHSRFGRAVNFLSGKGVVAVVEPEIGSGPLNVVVDELAPADRDDLDIGSRLVGLAGQSLAWRPDQIYDSSLAIVRGSAAAFTRNLPIFTRLLSENAPTYSLVFLCDPLHLVHFRSGFAREFALHVQRCVQDIFGGHLHRGIRRLRGCGFGLTPSGDDFIAGLLIGLNLLERIHRRDFGETRRLVYAAARSRNLLTDIFLSLAYEGRVCAKMKNLLTALLNAGAREIRRSTEELCSVGETSGADLATGFLLTVQSPPGALSWS